MNPATAITFTLDRLAVAEPNLELKGSMTLASTPPAIALNLSGKTSMLVQSVKTFWRWQAIPRPSRRSSTICAVARVPRISFTSHGENLDKLGDLNNILVKGQLQDGKVSVPRLSWI